MTAKLVLSFLGTVADTLNEEPISGRFPGAAESESGVTSDAPRTALSARKSGLSGGTFEAVEPFAQGAHRVQPEFTLSAERSEVVRLFRLLEAIPLG